MARTRFSGWQRGAAAVPLVLVSLAWPATLIAVGTPRADSGPQAPALPEISSALREPASTTSPGAPATVTVPAADAGSVTRTDRPAPALTDDSAPIPGVALAAYQFAEAVMRTADPSCELSWPVLAAIGRVESDHGRHGGATLHADGLAVPQIVGVPLDGSRGTARIPDTDSGRLDGDTRFDRAVGPMQFIPSTWSVVGVDGDHDGTREPQDIDDAALASAVYLCAGDGSLADRDGLHTAVHRYNHSRAYVDLVLSVASGYAGLDPGSAAGAQAWRALGPTSSGLPTGSVDQAAPEATQQHRLRELRSVPGRLRLVPVGPPAPPATPRATPRVPTPAPPAPPVPTPQTPAPTPQVEPTPTPEAPAPTPAPPEPTPEAPAPTPAPPEPTPEAPPPPAPTPTSPGPTPPEPTPPGPTPSGPATPQTPPWVWQVDWPAGWTPADLPADLPEPDGAPRALEPDELPVLEGAPEDEAFTEVLNHVVALCLADPDVQEEAAPDGVLDGWVLDGGVLDRAALYGLEEMRSCVLEWLLLSDAGDARPR